MTSLKAIADNPWQTIHKLVLFPLLSQRGRKYRLAMIEVILGRRRCMCEGRGLLSTQNTADEEPHFAWKE